ncbi:MAG: serine/threonine protein kinase [Polyangiaceae bacterium]|nr:serine/threonine protein kinase [Myxococcales bacterium]MCB9586288.1 serine/threonine protein kinase [Polyangiaceae bacterium]MCB9606965.1 serine/threonine protein kinase [Polyangiaceae bacterium]
MVAAKLIDVGEEGVQRIDRYDLVAEIASGGMATVYLARLAGVGGFQRFVAIKRLHPHLAKEKEFVEMFLDEARLAAGIHHPNVVPILEVGASERGYYLVMEYIEGDTLARLLARAATTAGKIPADIAIRILLDMLQGLHAAHELKDEKGQATELVHRDVSPQNILVGMDGVSRITDFGVARAASRLSATRVGQLKGKIAYMAPEQAAGDTRVDRRADIFSAGIVLWEVLASRRLFKAENEAATLSRVVSEPIPNLHDLAPDVHPQISLVCMKALERDPDKRFSTCAQFADVLERAAAAVGKIAAPREVAAYVQEVIGTEISQQRDAVRAWLARSEPSQLERPNFSLSTAPPAMAGASSSVSAGNMELSSVNTQSGLISHPQLSQISQVSEVHNTRRSKAPLVIGGVALLLALGVGGLVAAGSNKEEGPATAGAPEAPKTEAPAAEKPAAPAPKEEPKAEPAKAPEEAKPQASAEAKAEEKDDEKKAQRPVYGGSWRPKATKPEKVEEPAPAPKPTAAPKPDVDLSNPYK